MTRVVTRFAPSPTGYLHIGGARTALFNWLYARHFGGTFLLRIEDTDRARSTQDAVDALLDGLRWLELGWEGEPIFQFARMNRHAEIARQLVNRGMAYECYTPADELDAMRNQMLAEGKSPNLNAWLRDRAAGSARPAGAKPVIRILAPSAADSASAEMLVQDEVQGDVRVPYTQLDDMVLLRSDGTPTYMLSVVVDDHDMGITHVIRGDDHLTNTFRQRMIYDAMGWQPPVFAHVPMIHGQDGSKLSKRHGAVGLEQYRDMGYLPEAMRNYLLRLGWGHGDTEIITTEEAIKLFSLSDLGVSPSRMDFAKLAHVNAHYIRQCPEDRLMARVLPFIESQLGEKPDALGLARFRQGLGDLRERAQTLIELAHAGIFYLKKRPLLLEPDAAKTLDDDARTTLAEVRQTLNTLPDFRAAAIESSLKEYATAKSLKLGKIAMPLRCAITGTTSSPSVFHVAEILGREETLARLSDVA